MMPRDILQQAIELYGKEKQVDMAIEEMSELTKALLKERRKDALTGFSPDIPRLLDDVYEEIADVEIMIEQLKMIFNCYHQVENIRGCKCMRLYHRMNDKVVESEEEREK